MRTETPIEQLNARASLREAEVNLWRAVLAVGVITIALGAAAVILPFVATLTINVLVGIILVAVGAAHIFQAFSGQMPKEMALRAVSAAAYGLVGVLLLVFPRQGALTLTILLAALFVVVGAFRIALALHMQPQPGWGWLMFSGILAAALGVIIWTGLPNAAAWVIGLLVGIELLLSGSATVASALVMRRSRTTGAGSNEPFS
jgi:uncharacterized membrane protein HdeD (DUF308 family)